MRSALKTWQVSDALFLWARLWQISKLHIPIFPIQYHSHAGPGFNMASILEVCEAGCDYVDVGMEPLVMGNGTCRFA